MPDPLIGTTNASERAQAVLARFSLDWPFGFRRRVEEALEEAIEEAVREREAEIQRLRRALADYGMHPPLCWRGIERGELCACGLDAVVRGGYG